MLVTAVGVNSQTGIIMTLLGAAKTVAEEERKTAKREGKQNSMRHLLFFTVLVVKYRVSKVWKIHPIFRYYVFGKSIVKENRMCNFNEVFYWHIADMSFEC